MRGGEPTGSSANSSPVTASRASVRLEISEPGSVEGFPTLFLFKRLLLFGTGLDLRVLGTSAEIKKRESACISTKENNAIRYYNIGSSKAAGKTSVSEVEVESEEEVSERKRRMSMFSKIEAGKMMDDVRIELDKKGYGDLS